MISMTRVAALLALAASTTTALPSANPSFKFDGLSSDLAQQYYKLHSRNSSAPRLDLDDPIPDEIQSRLKKYSLQFSELSGLLQRAVLWDAGYVIGDGKSLATVYTACDKKMGDIALPYTTYKSSGCEAQSCTDPDTKRSIFCTGTQISTVATCAVGTDVKARFRASLWATGGRDDLLPAPHIIRHQWTDAGKSYLIFVIHTAANETPYGTCPTESTPASIIIPCVPYDEKASGSFCRPKPSTLVDEWLTQTQKGETAAEGSKEGESSSSTTGTTKSPASTTGSSETTEASSDNSKSSATPATSATPSGKSNATVNTDSTNAPKNATPQTLTSLSAAFGLATALLLAVL